MARSRRRTPIFGIAIADSEKAFKTAEHRRERRAARCLLDEAPPPRAFGNRWLGPKDGRRWWSNPPEAWMRK